MKDPKSYVDEIRRSIEDSRTSRLWRDSVNLLSTVSESVFSRSAHFILELLQNAEDAGLASESSRGEISFVINDTCVRVTHNGKPFSYENVDAICGVRSTKKPASGTLGFLGIGFKSVFKVTESPQVHSGEFHFCFNRAAHGDPTSTPWQIIPIWLDPTAKPANPKLTTFLLPFLSREVYEHTHAELHKLDVHVFLFLRWLKKLRIVDEIDGSETLIENLGEKDGIVTLKKNELIYRFNVFRRSTAVPKEISQDPALTFYKRQDVKTREVVIAFSVSKAGDLQPIEEASALGSVSSFLPLVEERSGAKFLIQADFLVQPGREAIQYELAWNRWLVMETVELVKQAIETFKIHPRWQRQFLPLFKFTYHGNEPAYDKLFRPYLETPLLAHLTSSDVVPTACGHHASSAVIVHPEDPLGELLTDADLPHLFQGATTLRLVHKDIDLSSLPIQIQGGIKSVDLGQVAHNKKLLEFKASQPGCAEWFRNLYLAMATTGRYFRQKQVRGKRGKIDWIDDPIYVLVDDGSLLPANEIFLRKIPEVVTKLRGMYPEVDKLLSTYRLVHPRFDTEELQKFFVERSHVQSIDFERICRNVFLPKVRPDRPAPSKDELIAYTRLLQKGPALAESIWVLTSQNTIKPSNQCFMTTAYSPSENWEKNCEYLPELDFLSPHYLSGVSQKEIPNWKKFFQDVGVKESGDRNNVERFAVAFSEHRLSKELEDFLARDHQRVGYDREARRKSDGVLVKLEVKGRKKEEQVVLDGNEPDAARNAQANGEEFWLCIVAGIPENPQLWIVEDVIEAGRFSSLTVDVSQWKARGRRVS